VARPDPQATAITRQGESRRNEERVLTESSLAGERRVSWVRLAFFLLLGVSQLVAAASGQALEVDAVRLWAIVAYGLFVVVMILGLRRVGPSTAGARWGPVGATLIDFGFLVMMAWRAYETDGQANPVLAAISYAVVQCFSIARYSWLHIVFSTAMAAGCYVGVGAMNGSLTPTTAAYVMGCYAALGLLLAMTNRSVRQMFLALRRRDNLSRFLPRPLVEQVLRDGEQTLAPSQAEVTILFTDIRGFTTLSEDLPPREVLRFLDQVLGQMAQVVKAHDGMVNKFLGDGMLAVWGVPEKSPRHALLALRAAFDILRVVAELNQTREAGGLPAIRIGIGIHSGTVAAGMLGGAEQAEYTVIGDAVNVASRIEGLTKTLGADLLVSGTTWAQLDGAYEGTRLADEPVRGRKDPVSLFAVKPPSV
jgi:adenylate cyclase